MKYLIALVSLFFIVSCSSTQETINENTELNMKKNAFLKEQTCSTYITEPKDVIKFNLSDIEKLNDTKIEIIEWNQSNWGGAHQTKSNLAKMVELKFSKLEDLYLGQNLTDDEDMKNIGKLTSLKRLDLSANQHITNKGLKELYSLQQLEELSLVKCPKLTGEGVHELQKILKNCKIKY